MLNLTRGRAEMRPLLPTMIDTVGYVHYRRGELDRAEPLLLQATEMELDNSVFQYHLGLAYHQQGRKSQAATALRRSLQRGADFPGVEHARQLLAELDR